MEARHLSFDQPSTYTRRLKGSLARTDQHALPGGMCYAKGNAKAGISRRHPSLRLLPFNTTCAPKKSISHMNNEQINWQNSLRIRSSTSIFAGAPGLLVLYTFTSMQGGFFAGSSQAAGSSAGAVHQRGAVQAGLTMTDRPGTDLCGTRTGPTRDQGEFPASTPFRGTVEFVAREFD